jgi:hypothetical protein
MNMSRKDEPKECTICGNSPGIWTGGKAYCPSCYNKEPGVGFPLLTDKKGDILSIDEWFKRTFDFELEPRQSGGVWECPICDGQNSFKTKEKLVSHIKHFHRPKRCKCCSKDVIGEEQFTITLCFDCYEKAVAGFDSR